MRVKMKCKYNKTCKLYRKNSVTCNEKDGMYYQDGIKPAGCYRDMEKRI